MLTYIQHFYGHCMLYPLFTKLATSILKTSIAPHRPCAQLAQRNSHIEAIPHELIVQMIFSLIVDYVVSDFLAGFEIRGG
jgi:hypothetical protein